MTFPLSKEGVRVFLLLVGATLLAHAAATAQTSNEESDQGACLHFDLPARHWAIDAVRRLEGAGLTTRQFSRRALSTCTALEVFEAAAATGDSALGLEREAAYWRLLLLEEYPGLLSDDEPGLPAASIIGARVQMGLAARRNLTAPGFGEFPPERTGSLFLSDRATATSSGALSLRLPLGLAASGTVAVDVDGLRVERADVSKGFGPLHVSAGRSNVGYGRAVGGAVALASEAPLNRLEFGLVDPVRMPFPLSWLGRFNFTTFLGRTQEDRHPGNPYLWGASGSVSPHPRLILSVHRATLFGGEGEAKRVTPGRVLDMIIGKIDGIGFEDQIVSFEGSWRLPTEAILPATVFTEWGAEDAGGGWWGVPGRIFGVHFPVISQVPGLSAGLERASFGLSCCGNPEWYRHWSFPGSWTLGGRPLGHPLGGNGTEWLGFANFDSPRDGLGVRLIGRRRFRGVENLFVPGRDGRSLEGSIEARWRPLGAPELFGSARAETGDGWREGEFSLGGRLFLN